MSKVVTIIVTYNGAKWIEKCITSVALSTVYTDIIVVDNCSTDNTCEIVESVPFPVVLIKNTENKGFGSANNIGLKQAFNEKADYVFLLNQDAYINRDTIEILIENQKNNPEYGILSPMQLNGNATGLDLYFERLLAPDNTKGFINDSYFNQLKSIYDVKFVMAAMWLISAECLKVNGVFEPLFYHYGEDSNYAQRALYHGFKIGVVYKSVGYHDREDRLVCKKEKTLYNVYIQFLTCSLDVNKPFFTTFLSAYKEYLAFVIKHLFSKATMMDLLRYHPLFDVPKIYKSRIKNKGIADWH